ncbi:hypothetical protein L596_016868 [Steinernema carpocapsae]|uniref:Uncharacterized protein n=1 Tax=Steinernema carpocapsae TaxID=34508 RepID=A0A4V6A3I3_STECR|nr:hypothetical protein L596_016868 [Steinernema carpocapsae]
MSSSTIPAGVDAQHIGSRVDWSAVSQKGGKMAKFESVSKHVTFLFAIKDPKAARIVVRCQACLNVNNRRRKQNEDPLSVPYIPIKDDKWTEDPENPAHPHICLQDHNTVSNLDSSQVASRQLYRVAVRGAANDFAPPKTLHNCMISNASEPIMLGDCNGGESAPHFVSLLIPEYDTSRKAFNYHQRANLLKVPNPYVLPEKILVKIFCAKNTNCISERFKTKKPWNGTGKSSKSVRSLVPN